VGLGYFPIEADVVPDPLEPVKPGGIDVKQD